MGNSTFTENNATGEVNVTGKTENKTITSGTGNETTTNISSAFGGLLGPVKGYVNSLFSAWSTKSDVDALSNTSTSAETNATGALNVTGPTTGGNVTDSRDCSVTQDVSKSWNWLLEKLKGYAQSICSRWVTDSDVDKLYDDYVKADGCEGLIGHSILNYVHTEESGRVTGQPCKVINATRQNSSRCWHGIFDKDKTCCAVTFAVPTRFTNGTFGRDGILSYSRSLSRVIIYD